MARLFAFCCLAAAACAPRDTGGAAPSLNGSRVDRAVWVATAGQPTLARTFAVALPLADGRVLVAGGFNAAGSPITSVELFTPATGVWSPGAPLSSARGQSAVAGGRVLTGLGTSLRSEVDLFDGDAGFVPTTPALSPRAEAVAVRLPDGTVLLLGGLGVDGPVASTELLQLDGGWVLASPLLVARSGPSATVLLDGRVLVAGGSSLTGPLASTEVRELDGGFRAGPNMLQPRARHTATLLSSGDVLLLGGDGDAGTLAELFRSATSTLAVLPGPKQSRAGHTATRLSDGQVLVAGGAGATAGELFDPDAGNFQLAGCLVRPREAHVAAPLATGVLLAFGRDDAGAMAHSERFVPTGGAAQGSACSADCECANGSCSHGVCCERACQGACETCAPVTGLCRFATFGTLCRASAGPCDLEDVCSGVSASCPLDGVRSAGIVCRSAIGGCDPPETCDGTSIACPPDARRDAGTLCRDAVGVCDLPERCDGDAGVCPVDRFAPLTTVCRDAGGACDSAERCTGASAFCPVDRREPEGSVCRPSAGACDVPEVCSGDPACPTDGFAAAGTFCPGFVCSGSAASCPSRCDADLACGTGAYCDAGVCLSSSPAIGTSRYVGWSCASAGPSSGAWLAAGVLAWLALRRRRRPRVAAVAMLAMLCGGVARAAPHEAGFFYTGDEGHPELAVRVQALFLKDVLTPSFGGEAGASVALAERFDLGAWVSLGRYPGARLGVTLHALDEGERFRPFLQLRGLLHPVPDGVAVGAGLFGGLTIELWRGRMVLGALLEGYAGPSSYVPAGVYVLGGYELDLYRAPSRRLAEPPPPPVAESVSSLPPAPEPPPSPAAPDLAPLPEALEPEAVPTPKIGLPPPEEPRTTVVTRVQIREQFLFGEKQSKLDPTLKARAQRLAAALQKLVQVKRLEVAGHADDAADDARCLALSQRRAEAVVEALVKGGVDRARLVAKGYGKAKALVPSKGPARQREKNRRVDFAVLEEAAP